MDLRQLGRGLAAFAVLSPTAFPLHHVQLFLVVAEQGPITYRDLEEALNLDNGTVSRVVAALGSEHWRGYPGFGLLETCRDPDEGRRFLVRLTAKGRALVRQLQGI
jgi:DNA-binding MarR family transcriptional regulator